MHLIHAGPESSEGELSSSLSDTEPASEPELPKPSLQSLQLGMAIQENLALLRRKFTKYGGAGIRPGGSALCTENNLQDS